MKRFVILFLSTSFILTACGKKMVRPSHSEMPEIHYGQLPRKIKPQAPKVSPGGQKQIIPPLKKTYLAFRVNPLAPAKDSDSRFIKACNLEFFPQNLNRKQELQEAVGIYTNLMKSYPDEEAFLSLRTGQSFLKGNQWDKASRYLYEAYLNGENSSELFFALAMIQKYKEHKINKALKSLLKVKPAELLMPTQDYWVELALLYDELKQTDKANKTYHTAFASNPERFLIHYDLLPFYIKNNFDSEAKTYLAQSFKYLMSLTNQDFHRKAMEQKIFFNRSQGIETFRYDFKLPNRYKLHPNLLYYLKTPSIHQRFLSTKLSLPVKERKIRRWDQIYYNLFEDIWNDGNKSTFTLIEAKIGSTNISSKFSSIAPKIRKLYFYQPTFIQLLPTNDLLISSNTNTLGELKEIISNKNSLIWMTNLNTQYFIDIVKVEADNDQTWDYLAIGIQASNEANLSFIFPKRQEIFSKNVFIKTRMASLVIQDVDGDGIKDWYLLDDGITLLNPPARP